MSTTKIVELFIDDEYDESGIEAISLVSRPAHDETWLAFNKQKCNCSEEVERLDSPYTIAEENFCQTNPKLDELGEPYSQLIQEGYRVVRVEKITPMEVHKMQEQKFSNPNADSILDSGNYLIRYKYIGPRDEKNRKFCSEMLAKNRVYRIEDIESLSNPEFGSYSIFLYRGSYNCRHAWVRLLYAKNDGPIRNSGSSTKGLKDQTVVVGLDTRNDATILNPGPNTWRPGEARDGSIFAPSYNDFAEKKGLEDACWEGYEAIGTKIVDGREVPNCVPVKMTKDDFAESISDYPEGVKSAAQRALNYAEKNGWGSCGTGVGKQRANQLAKGEPISVDTIKRMYSYLSRHKVDLESSKAYGEGCGKLMYDAWGGKAGLSWAERKLNQLEKEKMSKPKNELTSSDMEKWGGASLDGKRLLFFDEDKRIIVGAAMVPNKMIHRYDNLGNMYYVYFSKASIKKMAEKFMRQKRTDETNIEHDGIKLGADKVFVTESWISEDSEKDKSAAYGFSLPAGTWFVSMKVKDSKIWKMIKSGELTGFSVEGLFAEKSLFSKEDKQLNQIKQILKSINDDK